MRTIHDTILDDIQRSIIRRLDKCHLLYRIFSRVKDIKSLSAKIQSKGYEKRTKKLQDLLGVRVTVYFDDDVTHVIKILKGQFKLNNESIDSVAPRYFGPTRTNIVFDIDPKWINEFNESIAGRNNVIDSTFEVQVRTVLSEGWHEVEHDLRYKCLNDWESVPEFSRHLDGIYATLETSDASMNYLFNNLAYVYYKDRNWQAMLRNKFRLRILESSLSSPIVELLNSNKEIAKGIFRLDRSILVDIMNSAPNRVPMTYDNLIFIINSYFDHEDINSLMPDSFKKLVLR